MRLKPDKLARADHVYGDDDEYIGTIYYTGPEQMKGFRDWFVQIRLEAGKYSQQRHTANERLKKHRRSRNYHA